MIYDYREALEEAYGVVPDGQEINTGYECAYDA